jgi:hypothetical protein
LGLLGWPDSFQRLMERVLRSLKNVIVYKEDLLVHSDTHTSTWKFLSKCSIN